MTEACIDGINSVTSELKIDSRLIVLLDSPEGTKVVSKKLSFHQDVTRIKRNLFIVQRYSEIHEKLFQSHSFVSFIKTREIPTIRERMKIESSDRVYSLVSFSFRNPTAQQKKYVQRLIRKTTGIRLRSGVILFPLLKSKERKRIIGSEDEKVLIDSAEFTKLVQKNGGTALRWSRIRVINPEGSNYVDEVVQRTLDRDLIALEERIRALRERLKDSTIPIEQIKKNYGLLSRSYRDLKVKWMLAKKLWLYDAEKALKRIYNLLINTRQDIVLAEIERFR